jgi:hypothetical protein
MKTMRRFGVESAFLATAMLLVLGAQTGKAQGSGQEQKRVAENQAAGEKQPVDLAMIVPDFQSDEGQEAQQKVMLEVMAADAQVVKGKPYSADTSTETVQTMLDGNRIVHRTVSKFYRDSEGRTRREETFGNVDPEHPAPHETKVFIDDPVNRTSFVLDPGSKSADKMLRLSTITEDHNAEDDGTRVMVKSIKERETFVKDSEAAEPGGPAPMVMKFRDDHSGNPNTVVLQIADENRNVSKEDLGTRNIEGVDCTGTRRTTTIPAGAIGNEKPISIVTETWFAPTIGAVVQSTSEDPRFGKTTYQLTNVQLNEPPRSLFEPPADFKIATPRK